MSLKSQATTLANGAVSLCKTCNNSQCTDRYYLEAMKQMVIECSNWIHDLDKEDKRNDG